MEAVMSTIVVGVDGSENAARALKWAVGEATLRGAKLRIVSGWDVTPVAYSGGFSPGPVVLDSAREGAQAVNRRAVQEVHRLAPSLPCEAAVGEGPAADLIVKQAEDADLVVVGNRGHGELASFVLGSVSHEVAQHASCPVVVVRS